MTDIATTASPARSIAFIDSRVQTTRALVEYLRQRPARAREQLPL